MKNKDIEKNLEDEQLEETIKDEESKEESKQDIKTEDNTPPPTTDKNFGKTVEERNKLAQIGKDELIEEPHIEEKKKSSSLVWVFGGLAVIGAIIGVAIMQNREVKEDTKTDNSNNLTPSNGLQDDFLS